VEGSSDSPSIFFSAVHLETGLEDEQITGAILHSRLLISIVSEKTFQDMPGAIDVLGASCEGPLAHLLLHCELILERYGLFPCAEGGAVFPIYCGVEKDGVFEESKLESLWPSSTNLKRIVTVF